MTSTNDPWNTRNSSPLMGMAGEEATTQSTMENCKYI